MPELKQHKKGTVEVGAWDGRGESKGGVIWRESRQPKLTIAALSPPATNTAVPPSCMPTAADRQSRTERHCISYRYEIASFATQPFGQVTFPADSASRSPPAPRGRCVSTSARSLRSCWECGSQQYITRHFFFFFKGYYFLLFSFYFSPFFSSLFFFFFVLLGTGLCLASGHCFRALGPQLPVPPFGTDKTLQQGQGTGCPPMPQQPFTTRTFV